MKRFLQFLLLLLCLLAGVVWSLPQADPHVYQRKTMKFGGLERSYYVHVPTNRTQSMPLVILLHGGGGSAPQALDSYPLREVADREGFVLVAPNGTGPVAREILRTWNVGFGFGWAQKHDVDDAGFIRALILELRRTYPIDSKRVYLTGLSNGAILCHWAAAANSDLIAGIAPVVGCVGGQDVGQAEMQYPVKPNNPVNVIMFNGGLDDHIPPAGGLQKAHLEEQARRVCSAQQSAEFWVKANGCNPIPKTEKLPDQKATRWTWSGGRNGTQVVLYVLDNQGHAWPGGKMPRFGADKPSQLLKAHEVLWDFFASRVPNGRSAERADSERTLEPCSCGFAKQTRQR